MSEDLKSELVPQANSHKSINGQQTAGADLHAASWQMSTSSVHGGEERQKAFHGLTDAIVCSSTFSFANTQAVIDFIELDQERGEYGRYGNPSERVVEKKLAAMEGAEDAILFSSGMAALVTLLMTKLSAGDEIVFFDQCYHRSREFCAKHLARYGVITKQVRTGDYQAMREAVTAQTKLLVSESPTNPHLSVIDLEQFVAIGHQFKVATLIDATLATPYNLRPIAADVDYVLHSATKYLGGHNDLLAGVVLGRKLQLEDIRAMRGILGGVNSPQNCYLLQRGLKTFELRMQRHNENGQRVAEFLASHPKVERVLYPGLPTHPDHELAKRTMRGFGGLITFFLKDPTWQATAQVVDRCQIARIGPSLGGVETLIEQPYVMSYFKYSPHDRLRFGIPDNMIRLACGVENSDDIIADLDQALQG